MSSTEGMQVGTICWTDLTVADAEGIRDFYQAVVGWQAQGEDMGDFSDYNMLPPASDIAVAGVCHARGPNAKIPPVWLVYIVVDDIARSAATCVERGGAIVDGPRNTGGGHFCVIRDPAGAVCALYQPLR
jgi:predicted enzyme related to lactoylglutathione lyase